MLYFTFKQNNYIEVLTELPYNKLFIFKNFIKRIYRKKYIFDYLFFFKYIISIIITICLVILNLIDDC